MKKVMLYAYTAHNLGDDLFIYTLCQHYPDTEFLLYAPTKYKRTFANTPNISIIPNDRLVSKVIHRVLRFFRFDYALQERIAKQCDIAIYIGGSLFIEQAGWKQGLRQLKSMIKSNQKLFLLGANFGPYKSPAFLQSYQSLLAHFSGLSFRDEASKALFQGHAHVQQAADLVFQLQTNDIPRKKTNTIVISAIYPSIRKQLQDLDSAYFTSLARLAMDLTEQGYTVLFMSFCSLEMDDKAIAEMMMKIPVPYHSAIQHYHYHTDMSQALTHLASAKAVIATRFHAMILGWLFAKPTYPIVYSPKMKTVMEESNFQGRYTDIHKMETLKVNDIIKTIHDTPFDSNTLIQDAANHFSFIDSDIKEINHA